MIVNMLVHSISLPTFPMQIIPPHDGGISTHINAQLTPWPTSWDTSTLSNNPNILDPVVLGAVDSYFSDIQKYCFRYICIRVHFVCVCIIFMNL